MFKVCLIFQPDMNEVASVCLERLRYLADSILDTGSQNTEEAEDKRQQPFFLQNGHSSSSSPRQDTSS